MDNRCDPLDSVGTRIYEFLRVWRIDSHPACVGNHRRGDPVTAGTKGRLIVSAACTKCRPHYYYISNSFILLRNDSLFFCINLGSGDYHQPVGDYDDLPYAYQTNPGYAAPRIKLLLPELVQFEV